MTDAEERALEAAWKACSAWDGKITKPVLRKAIAAYMKEIESWQVQRSDGVWINTDQDGAAYWKSVGREVRPESRCEELVKDKWQPIDTVRRNKSVIFQSWWAHQPSAPYVFEGYLDWDGVTWRYQDGNPLKSDITAPVYWQDLPTPASYRKASDDLKEAEGVGE